MVEHWHFQTSDGGSGVEENEYACQFSCDNCGEEIHIAITKGITENEIIPQVSCPNCGCSNTKKWDKTE